MSEQHESRLTELGEIRLAQEIRQAQHNELIAYLEDGHGIGRRHLVNIYGPGILEAGNEKAAIIERWIVLCDTLRSTEKAMVALLRPREELTPGRYGFGKEAGYEPMSDIVIITNPRETNIAFEERGNDSWTVATLQQAVGYQLFQPTIDPPYTFDDLADAPRPMSVELAASTGVWNWDGSFSDLHQGIVVGDSYAELHAAIEALYAGEYEKPQAVHGDAAFTYILESSQLDAAKPWLGDAADQPIGQ